MSEKTRERVVVASIIAISGAVIWGVAELVFGGDQWFDSHWKLLLLVWGAAFLVAAFNIGLMCRVYESPTVRASAVIVAALMALTPIAANAGEGDSPTGSVTLDYTLKGFYYAWNWFTGNIADIAQAITTSNQPQPQGMANNIGGTMIAAPSGPQAPAGGEGKFRSHEK